MTHEAALARAKSVRTRVKLATAQWQARNLTSFAIAVLDEWYFLCSGINGVSDWCIYGLLVSQVLLRSWQESPSCVARGGFTFFLLGMCTQHSTLNCGVVLYKLDFVTPKECYSSLTLRSTIPLLPPISTWPPSHIHKSARSQEIEKWKDHLGCHSLLIIGGLVQ